MSDIYKMVCQQLISQESKPRQKVNAKRLMKQV